VQHDVNASDHQDLILCFHFARRICCQLPGGCIDLTRFQRAPEGSSQSTRSRGDNVIERGRMRFEDLRWHFVVLRYCAVYSEENRRLFRRQPCAPEGAFHTLDPHTRHVRWIRHVEHDKPAAPIGPTFFRNRIIDKSHYDVECLLGEVDCRALRVYRSWGYQARQT
jgi:hypothetical protein